MTDTPRGGSEPSDAPEPTPRSPEGLSAGGIRTVQGAEDGPANVSDAGPLATPYDVQQIELAGRRLQEFEHVRPETWEGLDTSERLQALQQVEYVMADLHNRPPRELLTERMPRGEYGYFNGNRIHVSLEAVERGSVQENVDTVIHEGRHAYQRIAVDTPGFHTDQNQVEAWRRNFADYRNAQFDVEEYRLQPLEADAWAYASRIRARLYGTQGAGGSE